MSDAVLLAMKRCAVVAGQRRVVVQFVPHPCNFVPLDAHMLCNVYHYIISISIVYLWMCLRLGDSEYNHRVPKCKLDHCMDLSAPHQVVDTEIHALSPWTLNAPGVFVQGLRVCDADGQALLHQVKFNDFEDLGYFEWKQTACILF